MRGSSAPPGSSPRLGRLEDGFRTSREAEAVRARRQPDAGGAVPVADARRVLGAVEEVDGLAVGPRGGVEDVLRLPGVALRGEDGVAVVLRERAELPRLSGGLRKGWGRRPAGYDEDEGEAEEEEAWHGGGGIFVKGTGA